MCLSPTRRSWWQYWQCCVIARLWNFQICLFMEEIEAAVWFAHKKLASVKCNNVGLTITRAGT